MSLFKAFPDFARRHVVRRELIGEVRESAVCCDLGEAEQRLGPWPAIVPGHADEPAHEVRGGSAKHRALNLDHHADRHRPQALHVQYAAKYEVRLRADMLPRGRIPCLQHEPKHRPGVEGTVVVRVGWEDEFVAGDGHEGGASCGESGLATHAPIVTPSAGQVHTSLFAQSCLILDSGAGVSPAKPSRRDARTTNEDNSLRPVRWTNPSVPHHDRDTHDLFTPEEALPCNRH